MDVKLAKMLLRYAQSEESSFQINKTIEGFVRSYGDVGSISRNKVVFSPPQKENIGKLLLSAGIDPNTPPDAWNGLTRSEALSLGNNEKFATSEVMRRRVAIKTLLPTSPLSLAGQKNFLPSRCHVDIDHEEVDGFLDHDLILVVENWESFSDIHLAAQHPDLSFPGENPLVIWRGWKNSVRSSLELLNKLHQPVFYFGDYDPAGLMIARSLPRLSGFVAPSLARLAELLKKQGLSDRYEGQLSGCFDVLERQDTPCINNIWDVIKRSGRALPQEVFTKEQ